jgi:hypothetical protein
MADRIVVDISYLRDASFILGNVSIHSLCCIGERYSGSVIEHVDYLTPIYDTSGPRYRIRSDIVTKFRRMTADYRKYRLALRR